MCPTCSAEVLAQRVDWYKRWIGDYGRDTGRLRPLEHGIYNLLLDHYYAEEAPLPAALRDVYPLAKCVTKTERSACQKVVSRFFPVGVDGLRHNGRADEEIGAAKAAMQKAKESGQAGAAKRWGLSKSVDPPPENGGDPIRKPIEKSMASQNPESRSQRRTRSPPTPQTGGAGVGGANGTAPEKTRSERAIEEMSARGFDPFALPGEPGYAPPEEWPQS